MPTCRSWKTGLECWKLRPYKVRSLVSNSICAKKDRNYPPSASQAISRDKPRDSHAVCTLRVHPPTSPCPVLSAHTEPKSQGHCWKWHHEAESLMMDISTMVPKELTTFISISHQVVKKWDTHFPLILNSACKWWVWEYTAPRTQGACLWG